MTGDPNQTREWFAVRVAHKAGRDELALLYVLHSLVGVHGETVWPSIAWLAKVLGIGEPRVRRGLNRLAELGLIRDTGERRRSVVVWACLYMIAITNRSGLSTKPEGVSDDREPPNRSALSTKPEGVGGPDQTAETGRTVPDPFLTRSSPVPDPFPSEHESGTRIEGNRSKTSLSASNRETRGPASAKTERDDPIDDQARTVALAIIDAVNRNRLPRLRQVRVTGRAIAALAARLRAGWSSGQLVAAASGDWPPTERIGSGTAYLTTVVENLPDRPPDEPRKPDDDPGEPDDVLPVRRPLGRPVPTAILHPDDDPTGDLAGPPGDDAPLPDEPEPEDPDDDVSDGTWP